MKIPRDLSGSDLIKVLCRSWGYKQVHQVGSHVILETKEPSQHRLASPGAIWEYKVNDSCRILCVE